jgi:hypothetical protein
MFIAKAPRVARWRAPLTITIVIGNDMRSVRLSAELAAPRCEYSVAMT